MGYKIPQVMLSLILTLNVQISGQMQPGKINKGELRYTSVRETDQIKNQYIKAVSDPKEFINGREYISYYYRSNTTPLIFLGKEFNAVLYMNGRRYENIKLQYDTFLDEVIYTDTSQMINFQFPKVALNNQIVQGFSFATDFDSLNFRYLKFPKDSGSDMQDGYYESVTEGSSRLLIKHRSKQYRDQAVYEYDYVPALYVSIGGGYVKIKKKKDFLLLFGNYSLRIREFLNETKIFVPRAGKDEITRVLKYYNSLLNSETGPR